MCFFNLVQFLAAFLFKFKAIFPLDLFPDEVILDKLKISIIKTKSGSSTIFA